LFCTIKALLMESEKPDTLVAPARRRLSAMIAFMVVCSTLN
jgi:hypothetical protein